MNSSTNVAPRNATVDGAGWYHSILPGPGSLGRTSAAALNTASPRLSLRCDRICPHPPLTKALDVWSPVVCVRSSLSWAAVSPRRALISWAASHRTLVSGNTCALSKLPWSVPCGETASDALRQSWRQSRLSPIKAWRAVDFSQRRNCTTAIDLVISSSTPPTRPSTFRSPFATSPHLRDPLDRR